MGFLMDIKCWQSFVPPQGLKRHIRNALACIEPQDLAGIDHVLLLEDIPEISRRLDKSIDEALKDGLLILGAYRPRDLTTSAHIILIVKNLYEPIPRVLVNTSAMTMRIAE